MEDETKVPWMRNSDYTFNGLDKTFGNLPELVTDAICNSYIRQLGHNSFCSRIHKVQRSTVVRLFKCVLFRESIFSLGDGQECQVLG